MLGQVVEINLCQKLGFVEFCLHRGPEGLKDSPTHSKEVSTLERWVQGRDACCYARLFQKELRTQINVRSIVITQVVQAIALNVLVLQ